MDHGLRRDGTVPNRKMQQKLYLHRSCVPLDVAIPLVMVFFKLSFWVPWKSWKWNPFN